MQRLHRRGERQGLTIDPLGGVKIAAGAQGRAEVTVNPGVRRREPGRLAEALNGVAEFAPPQGDQTKDVPQVAAPRGVDQQPPRQRLRRDEVALTVEAGQQLKTFVGDRGGGGHVDPAASGAVK